MLGRVGWSHDLFGLVVGQGQSMVSHLGRDNMAGAHETWQGQRLYNSSTLHVALAGRGVNIIAQAI